jgi:hypothetical protein
MQKIYHEKEELAEAVAEFQRNDRELQEAMEVLATKHEQYKRESEMKIYDLEE